MVLLDRVNSGALRRIVIEVVSLRKYTISWKPESYFGPAVFTEDELCINK